MQVLKIDGDYLANTYIIEDNGQYLIVDTSHSINAINEVLRNKKLQILTQDTLRSTMHSSTSFSVFITHAHFDHIYYIEEWARAGVKIFMSKKAFYNMQNAKLNASFLHSSREFKIDMDSAVFVEDGENIKVGNVEFQVLKTAGHTDCSLSLLGYGMLFCGDLMFAEGYVGRTDLPTGDSAELERSLFKIDRLSKPLKVYAGHGEPFEIKLKII